MTITVKNTFKKSERLTSKVSMEKIFAQGITIKKFPLILKYSKVDFEDGQPLKIVISVPKRRIKKAHNRNRIRRQLKEAYRLNRLPLKQSLAQQSKSLALFFIYTGKENPDYSVIEEKIQLLLKELMKIYPKPASEEKV